MASLLNDIRLALRGLRKSPGFTAAAVLTIALGISATAVVFSLVSTLLLRPLPVPAPERLVSIDEMRERSTYVMNGVSAISFDRYEGYRDGSREVFSGVAGLRYDGGSLRIDGTAGGVTLVAATSNYFEVLGLRPEVGSTFAPDANRTREPVVVISHEMWSNRFGADPQVVGRTLHLDSRPVTVIGVAPRGFTGTMAGIPVDVWLPAAAGDGTPGSGDALTVFGRLRDGVSPEQASAALSVLARQLPTEQVNNELLGVRLHPMTSIPPDFRTPLIGFMSMLFAMAGLVLLIASTNVGGMLLARATSRRREVAIRLAIGASRRRVVQQQLTESVLLFLLGGGVGVLLTQWVTRLASGFQPPIPIRIAFDFAVDGRVLAFTCGAALLSGIVFGLAPARQASRAEVLPALKDGERGQTAGRARLRSAFVTVQLAMSLLLLVTAGLFARTLQQALASDIGFNPDGVVIAGFNLDPHGYDSERGRALQAQLLEQVRAIPGIESAAYAVWAPLGGNIWTSTVRTEPSPDAEGIPTSMGRVGTGYFETLQIPLIAGRAFTPADREGAARVGVINERLAARLWPGATPIGQTLYLGDEPHEVVGVVRNGKYESYTEEERPHLYVPLEQLYSGSAVLLARSRTDPVIALGAIRRELAALDANVAVEQSTPLASLIGLTIFPQRMAATMIGVFGLVGLLLAAIGLYGILAYHVSARTREIGIRIALGAHATQLVRMVLRSSIRLVLTGIAIGLVAAVGATRLLASMLYGITPTDPVTFLAVPLLLLAVALIASYLPVRRATRVDPMVAIRAE